MTDSYKNSPIYTNFIPDELYTVRILALIFVPNRILIGIIKTDAKIDNKFPHMTFFTLRGWEAFISNAIVHETCLDPKKFKNCY